MQAPSPEKLVIERKNLVVNGIGHELGFIIERKKGDDQP